MRRSKSVILSGKKIGDLVLKNRIIKAGCFEGMSPEGGVSPQLIAHHTQIAAGGVAMTTVAYTSVSMDGRAYPHEMWMRRELVPELKKLTSSVHRQGAAASVQLGHCGYFASRAVIGRKPVGASAGFNLFRLSFCRAMSRKDIGEKVSNFTQAAETAREAGFDAVEIHAGHGYLLSQFISPYTNKRKDEYGGSLENRMRFPMQVVESIRNTLGEGFPVLVKMNLYDGFRGGLVLNDAVRVAQMFEKAGANALVPSSGFTSKTPFMMLRGNVPVEEMVANQKNLLTKTGLRLFGKIVVEEIPFRRLFHLKDSAKILAAVDIPVVYVGGVVTEEDVLDVLEAGFSFVQMGRGLIREPGFVKNLQEHLQQPEPLCDHCNRCVAAMDAGGVYCVSQKQGFI